VIAQVKTPRQRQRFLNACREKLCLGATMPLALSLFGKSQPGRFFAGPTLALDVGGSTAWLAGHANPDELAGFLNFCGCEAVVLDEAGCPPPTGWKRAKTLSAFGLPPGQQLPLPEADAALWQSLEKNTEPAAGKTAEMLFSDRPGKRDDFYSELCSKRSRGLARVWALEREGEIVCTVGAYALADGQAYMACGETAEALRGRGIGGRLIVGMANALSAEGWMPVFLCSPERVHFYTRLGFERLGEYARYTSQ
jgi:GNAT superfamily N-acetyltransferase